MKQSLLFFALTAISCSSFAYNVQFDAGFRSFDYDNNYIDQDYQADIKGKYYFDPVQIKNNPLNEAAFLGRNSNVYGGYAYRTIESQDYLTYDPLSTSTFYELARAKDEKDLHYFTGGLEYFHEQFYLNGEIGLGIVKIKSNINSNYGSVRYKNDYNVTTYRALVGYMPISNLLIAAGVDGFSGDKYLDDETDFAAKIKYVMPIGQNGHYLNLEANGVFGDENNVIFAADYYLTRAFSIGSAYSLKDDDESNNNFLWFRSKYFVNENVAIGAEAGFSSGMNLFNVNGTFRF
ncbi:hypothetical protein KTI63_17710 [Acinetobacter guillouiae]|nr:putative porin [Acinetobacter guillouiae]MCU4494290.1 hypothetical protein [Acinetobacter guillouiae]